MWLSSQAAELCDLKPVFDFDCVVCSYGVFQRWYWEEWYIRSGRLPPTTGKGRECCGPVKVCSVDEKQQGQHDTDVGKLTTQTWYRI